MGVFKLAVNSYNVLLCAYCFVIDAWNRIENDVFDGCIRKVVKYDIKKHKITTLYDQSRFLNTLYWLVIKLLNPSYKLQLLHKFAREPDEHTIYEAHISNKGIHLFKDDIFVSEIKSDSHKTYLSTLNNNISLVHFFNKFKPNGITLKEIVQLAYYMKLVDTDKLVCSLLQSCELKVEITDVETLEEFVFKNSEIINIQ